MNGDFRVGAWLVRPSLNSISQNGSTIQLEPKVMEVLVCLAHNPGETLPKEQLLKTVWPDTFVSDDVLIRTVSELRRIFGDDPREPKFIQTIPKRGYRLVAPVTGVNGTEPAPIPEPVNARSTTGERNRALWIVVPAVLGVGLLVFLLAVFNIHGLRDRFFGKNDTPAIHSLAVLPLKNLSNDPAQKYFAYGMAEELITDLSQMSGLKVISHTSVLRYQDTEQPVPEIARDLGADAVIEGAVQRSGDRVRVSAQLIYAPNDTNLWAKTYDRDLRDVLALQSTVAREIADEIRVKMTPQQTARLAKPRVVNPEALDAYWKAQYHLSLLEHAEFVNGQKKSSENEFRQTIANFEQAIQRDPNYAPAYLGYSDAIREFAWAVDPNTDLRAQVKPALMKALVLDDALTKAHGSLGNVFFWDEWNWAGAEKEYRRALELDPNSGEAHDSYANYLDSMGRLQEGLKEHELQLQLDPDVDDGDSPLLPIELRIERMQKFVETHERSGPDAHWALGLLLARGGRYKEATDEWSDLMARYGWTGTAQAIRRGYKKAGYRGALRAWAQELEAIAKKRQYFPPNMLAYLYGELGDKDRAFACMEKAYQGHEGSIAEMKVALDYEPLRSDPRFAAMLRRVGLPQ